MRGVKSFQPPARAVLPEFLAFVLAQAEKTCGVPEHDLIDLIVVVSHRSQEQSHDVGERLRKAASENGLPARSSTSRCRRAADSSLPGKRSLNAFMHSRIFLLAPTLRISPSELMSA